MTAGTGSSQVSIFVNFPCIATPLFSWYAKICIWYWRFHQLEIVFELVVDAFLRWLIVVQSTGTMLGLRYVYRYVGMLLFGILCPMFNHSIEFHLTGCTLLGGATFSGCKSRTGHWCFAE